MGKHHKSRVGTMARVAIVPSAAAAVLVAASGAAQAAPNELPSQGGVTSAPSTQGGVTSAPSTQGGVTSGPEQPEPVYWVEPPAQYQNIEYQPLENYDYDTNTYDAPDDYYVAPVQVQDLHLPTYVEPTAPIIAPRETLRLGTYHVSQPNWMTDGDLARTNNTSAVIEAEVSTFWRSLGIETTRANRLAAAQLGMGAANAAGWGVVGALAGGTIGGVIGAGMIGGVELPLPGGPAFFVTNGVAGTAIGAAVGAAVFAAPAAVTGVVAGTMVGAGDLGEPQPLPDPADKVFRDIEKPEIKSWTEETLAQWETNPAGAVAASAVRDTVAAAPEMDRQARDFVASQPGGDQVLDQVDARLATFFTDSSLGVASNMISDAVGTGVQA
ncbi:hypothetical protein EGT67_19110 [Prescottella agglutinans]|uniref:Insoluble domain protein n=1 Tax=Prescottella agglutinans TaxID=1644129 RepID=A0A3S3E8X7_9NOCA|nr:hypothetical protein [Prescottella agglutinans]RVW08034.1 hypothetical protein EGT67_19110 [Prescottella agglutinans]